MYTHMYKNDFISQFKHVVQLLKCVLITSKLVKHTGRAHFHIHVDLQSVSLAATL